MARDKEQKNAYMREWRKRNPNYDKERYLKNKEYFKDNNRRNRDKKRKWVREYKKSHPCVKCGESDPCCLDFHHFEDNKEANIADLMKNGASIERIQAEIEKCIVLCANCHRKKECLLRSR
jgi:phage terminase large subunit-like protein